jgi:RecA/RadA recombinase
VGHALHAAAAGAAPPEHSAGAPAAAARLQGLEATISAREVKLVVIDSIAALLRLDFQGRERLGERQELLGQQAAALKLLAERHNIPVLVTNQVRGCHSCCGGGPRRRRPVALAPGRTGRAAAAL